MQTAETSRDALGKSNLRNQLDRFFSSVGQGFNAYLEALSRAHEVERLNALSDEQLAGLGLQRDEIVRHVFRDRFHV